MQQFLTENWILILMALVSGWMLLAPMVGKGGGAGSVSPQEAVRLMNREKAVVVDVCETAEYAAGHIVGSKNMPLGSLGEAKGLPTNKATPLVVVCATGARSRRGAAQLRKAGHENVSSMVGGMAAWREAGLPVEKA